jgi:NTE family protein
MSTARQGLVLTGGGARGAYQAGALLALAELTHARELPFPVLAGSSAGSINAAFLATRADDFGAATASLAELWATLEPERVFETATAKLAETAARWLLDLGFGSWIGTGRGKALLDTSPLRALLATRFDAAALQRHVESGRVHGIAVTATDYEDGVGVTFYQGQPSIEPWSRVTRVGVRAHLTSQHLLASSAIPIFFPAVALDDAWYADGCIRLSTPLGPAIRLGADRLIAIAVRQADLGTPRPEPRLPHGAAAPTPAQVGGLLLNALFLEALESDVERARRINETLRYVHEDVVAGYATPLRPIDVLVLRPSRDPALLVASTVDRFRPTARHLFRGLGVSAKAGLDLLSYLAFDRSYTTRLLELGHEDTMGRRRELLEFLEGHAPASTVASHA